MNPRPPGYEPDELPDCSTPRHCVSQRRIYYTTANALLSIGESKFSLQFRQLFPFGPSRLSRKPGEAYAGGQSSGASAIFLGSSRIWMCWGQTCSHALFRWPIGPFDAAGRRCAPTSPLRRFRNLLLFLADMDMPGADLFARPFPLAHRAFRCGRAEMCTYFTPPALPQSSSAPRGYGCAGGRPVRTPFPVGPSGLSMRQGGDVYLLHPSSASTIFFSSSRIWMCWGQTCSHAPHSRQALAMLWLRPTVFQ